MAPLDMPSVFLLILSKSILQVRQFCKDPVASSTVGNPPCPEYPLGAT